ncbi:hypothetical protein D3C84_935820 [compost metagenome]
MRSQALPEWLVDVSAGMQAVRQCQQHQLGRAPQAGIGQRGAGVGELLGGEPGLAIERRDMHAPFVFRTAQGGGPQDQQFALAQADAAPVEQAAGDQALQHPRVVRHAAKQLQRRHARGHDALESGLDIRGIGWLHGLYTGSAHGHCSCRAAKLLKS